MKVQMKHSGNAIKSLPFMEYMTVIEIRVPESEFYVRKGSIA